jgi:hypothetical protein
VCRSWLYIYVRLGAVDLYGRPMVASFEPVDCLALNGITLTQTQISGNSGLCGSRSVSFNSLRFVNYIFSVVCYDFSKNINEHSGPDQSPILFVHKFRCAGNELQTRVMVRSRRSDGKS